MGKNLTVPIRELYLSTLAWISFDYFLSSGVVKRRLKSHPVQEIVANENVDIGVDTGIKTGIKIQQIRFISKQQ